MKTRFKKTQITSNTQHLPLSNFSQSAVVVLDPFGSSFNRGCKNVLVNKVLRRLLSIMSERGCPRASYTAAFKLRVIAYAVSHGNHATGRQFPIDESCVRPWRSQCERLLKSPRNKWAERFRWAAIAKEVAAWITAKRQGGIGVSANVIYLKAKTVVHKFGIAETSFKASQRWCYGFMERYGFSIRRRTTIAQWLPQDYEEKLIRFQCFIIAQRKKKHDFELKYSTARNYWLLYRVFSTSTTHGFPSVIMRQDAFLPW